MLLHLIRGDRNCSKLCNKSICFILNILLPFHVKISDIMKCHSWCPLPNYAVDNIQARGVNVCVQKESIKG